MTRSLPMLIAALLAAAPPALAQQEMDFSEGGEEAPAVVSPDDLLAAAANHHELARQLAGIGRTSPEALAAMYKAAIEGYERFAERYPEDPRATETRLAKAQAQREMGDHEGAAVTCAKLRDREGALPERAKAALCAVYAWQTVTEALQAKGGAQRPNDAQREEAYQAGRTLPMPEPVERLAEAMGYFLNDHETFDVEPEVRSRVAYLLGDLLAAYGHKDRAQAAFEKALSWRPARDVAEAAAEELLAPSRERSDWDAYLATVARLLTVELHKPEDTVAFRATLEKNRVAAGYSRAMALLKAEAWGDAEAALGALVAADPSHTDAPGGLFNRAYALEKLGRAEDARDAYLALVERHPKHTLASRAMLVGARLCRETHRPDDAIRLWQEFARRFPKADEAGDALLAAADLLARDNRVADAAALVDQHIKKYGAKASLLRNAGDMSLTLGRDKDALAHYRRYLGVAEAEGEPAPERVRVMVQSGLVSERLGKAKDARAHFEKAVGLARVAGVQSEWVERASAKLGGR